MTQVFAFDVVRKEQSGDGCSIFVRTLHGMSRLNGTVPGMNTISWNSNVDMVHELVCPQCIPQRLEVAPMVDISDPGKFICQSLNKRVGVPVPWLSLSLLVFLSVLLHLVFVKIFDVKGFVSTVALSRRKDNNNNKKEKKKEKKINSGVAIPPDNILRSHERWREWLDRHVYTSAMAKSRTT